MAAKKLPAFQFYPGDWLKEPRLKVCSHATKGVFIDVLCLMFECEERGVLATAGRAWSETEIARAVGGDQDVTIPCIRELIEKGVVSRSETGAIYCRRMVRDEHKRRLCGEAGKKGGGNPALTNKGGSKGASKGHSKGHSKASDSLSISVSPSGYGFLRDLSLSELQDATALLARYEAGVRAGAIAHTQLNLLWFFACAERAIEVATENPGGFFYKLISTNDREKPSNAQEERARRKLFQASRDPDMPRPRRLEEF